MALPTPGAACVPDPPPPNTDPPPPDPFPVSTDPPASSPPPPAANAPSEIGDPSTSTAGSHAWATVAPIVSVVALLGFALLFWLLWRRRRRENGHILPSTPRFELDQSGRLVEKGAAPFYGVQTRIRGGGAGSPGRNFNMKNYPACPSSVLSAFCEAEEEGGRGEWGYVKGEKRSDVGLGITEGNPEVVSRATSGFLTIGMIQEPTPPQSDAGSETFDVSPIGSEAGSIRWSSGIAL